MWNAESIIDIDRKVIVYFKDYLYMKDEHGYSYL